MKKVLSLILCMAIMMPLFPAYSASASNAIHFQYEAQKLYDLGLFKGTNNGFDLDKKCDRLQGAALFVRLLGEEKSALASQKQHPFTDVKNNWGGALCRPNVSAGLCKRRGTCEVRYSKYDSK